MLIRFIILYFEFFKIGLFAVGGGLATIPFLEKLCDKYDWFTKSDLSNMIAISESTPGPIGVNMATYAGFTNGSFYGGIFSGIVGGIIATIGLITPAIVITLIISGFLEKFKTNKYVENGFYGIRPAVVGLIAAAVLSIYKSSLFNNDFSNFDYRVWLIFVPIVIASFKFKKIHPIFLIVAGAVLGIVFGGVF